MPDEHVPELLPCPFCGKAPNQFEDGEIQCSDKMCVRPGNCFDAFVWNARATRTVPAKFDDGTIEGERHEFVGGVDDPTACVANDGHCQRPADDRDVHLKAGERVPATAAQDEAMKAAKLVQDAINDDPRMLDDQVGLAGVISRALATPPSERIAGTNRWNWMYEDQLPANMPKADYDKWFAESDVVDGVRMGPRYPRTAEGWPSIESAPKGRKILVAYRNPHSRQDIDTFIDIVEGMERENQRLRAEQQASADLIASLQSDVDKGHGWYRECAALTVEIESLRSQLTQQAAEIASLKQPE